MADTTNTAASTGAGGEKLSKARAEFDKYRARMGEARSGVSPEGPFGKGMPMFPGAQAPGNPSPFSPFYGSPFTMPQYPMPPFQPGGQMGPPQPGMPPFAGSGPLFENIGRMMQMGVTFATAAFAGGMQMMQGFGGAPYGGLHSGPGHHGNCESEPHQRQLRGDCGCHDDHCEDSHGHDDCCCNPGVSDCGCCCG